MRRREFIAALGGAAALAVCRTRAAGRADATLRGAHTMATDDQEGKARVAAFQQGLRELGWTDGRNVQIDIRWTGGDTERIRAHAAELVALKPDVILAAGGTVMGSLLQATRTLPIVFTRALRPGWLRLRGELGETGWQRYRLYCCSNSASA